MECLFYSYFLKLIKQSLLVIYIKLLSEINNGFAVSIICHGCHQVGKVQKENLMEKMSETSIYLEKSNKGQRKTLKWRNLK